MTDTDIARILAVIPMFSRASLAEINLKPLAGLSNTNFRIRYRHNDYILRIPKRETAQFIDRASEANNEDLVTGAGFAPEVLWRNQHGVSLSRYLGCCRTLTITDFNDDSIFGGLALCLRKLHTSKLEFKGRTDIAGLLNSYFERIGRQYKSALSASLEKAMDIHQAVDVDDGKRIPSHNDLVLDNILLGSDEKIWLIDWEYSALSSPYWDLATLCNSARLERQRCADLLQAYGGDSSALTVENLLGHGYLLQLLTVLWTIAHAESFVEAEMEWLKHLDKSV